MNPRQHGEVFVTHDGAETDLDLGHYERFTNAVMSADNSFSTGRVYDAVINKERRGDYLGGTVQVVPHITDEIRRLILAPVRDADDIAIVEIGGTVGDIESLPFLEAIRQIRSELSSEHVLFVHVTLVPWLEAAQELKTKPTQHSVKNLRQTGIQPDVLICRASRLIPPRVLQKISMTCDVPRQAAIQAQDLDSIYKLPLHFYEQGLDQVIVDKLKIWARRPDLSVWQKISRSLDAPQGTCNIGIVGKYVDVIDSYKSVHEALIHAGIATRLRVVVNYIDAEQLEQQPSEEILQKLQGIIVPGGFGERGIDGKIQAINYCRRRNIPFFGICYGMQLAVIEFARHQLNLPQAGSTEIDQQTQDPVIDLMPEQKANSDKGATMRLGAYPCKLKRDSKVLLFMAVKKSANVIGIVLNSTTLTVNTLPHKVCLAAVCHLMTRWWKLWSCKTTRGMYVASFTPNYKAPPAMRIPCSVLLWRQPTNGTKSHHRLRTRMPSCRSRSYSSCSTTA